MLEIDKLDNNKKGGLFCKKMKKMPFIKLKCKKKGLYTTNTKKY